MITKYRVIENGTQEICVANSPEEASTVVACYQMQNPHNTYEVVEYQESSVKPGFGRDPDLH